MGRNEAGRRPTDRVKELAATPIPLQCWAAGPAPRAGAPRTPDPTPEGY